MFSTALALNNLQKRPSTMRAHSTWNTGNTAKRGVSVVGTCRICAGKNATDISQEEMSAKAHNYFAIHFHFTQLVNKSKCFFHRERCLGAKDVPYIFYSNASLILNLVSENENVFRVDTNIICIQRILKILFWNNRDIAFSVNDGNVILPSKGFDKLLQFIRLLWIPNRGTSADEIDIIQFHIKRI